MSKKELLLKFLFGVATAVAAAYTVKQLKQRGIL